MSASKDNLPLIIALPSKGRLKEQAEAWLADCGFRLDIDGGARGYRATLRGLPGAEVRLLSAGDIAQALDGDEIHIGLTGEDLLRERDGDVDARMLKLLPLGFGRADLVVAAPKSWLDVETMADVEDVAHLYLARTGQRLRVATKYMVQTRAFFARHGIADYRIVESLGATEGAPAAGAAELVVDITTTGATLVANGLKVLSDGLILKSQAQLVASLRTGWSPAQAATAEDLLRRVEARAAALTTQTLIWPPQVDKKRETDEAAVVDRLVAEGASRRPNGLLVESSKAASAALKLTKAGLGPVTASRPEFVFDTRSPATEALRSKMF